MLGLRTDVKKTDRSADTLHCSQDKNDKLCNEDMLDWNNAVAKIIICLHVEEQSHRHA